MLNFIQLPLDDGVGLIDHYQMVFWCEYRTSQDISPFVIADEIFRTPKYKLKIAVRYSLSILVIWYLHSSVSKLVQPLYLFRHNAVNVSGAFSIVTQFSPRTIGELSYSRDFSFPVFVPKNMSLTFLSASIAEICCSVSDFTLNFLQTRFTTSNSVILSVSPKG